MDDTQGLGELFLGLLGRRNANAEKQGRATAPLAASADQAKVSLLDAIRGALAGGGEILLYPIESE